MESNAIDVIIEDLFHVVRLIHKKLLRGGLEGAQKDISRPHFAIMTRLDELEASPVSEIGKRLLIPKPQMTHLVDKLIRLGLVERLPDTQDRRIINIALSDKGKITLQKCRKSVRNNMRKKLSCLKDEELEELSVSLRKIRDIGSKLG